MLPNKEEEMVLYAGIGILRKKRERGKPWRSWIFVGR